MDYVDLTEEDSSPTLKKSSWPPSTGDRKISLSQQVKQRILDLALGQSVSPWRIVSMWVMEVLIWLFRVGYHLILADS